MSQPALASMPTNDDWRAAAQAAITYIASEALGRRFASTDADYREGTGLAGALVPIVSDFGAVQIGLFATDAGCAALTRALLQMDDSDAVDGPTVADAISEIVNMLAGNVKGRIKNYAGGAALGLPTYIHGWIEAALRQVVETVAGTIGGTAVFVVVVRSAG